MKYAVLIGLVVLGFLFFRQKSTENSIPAPPQATLAPRPASKHDWAKSALDRAHDVTGQVKRERASNEVP